MLWTPETRRLRNSGRWHGLCRTWGRKRLCGTPAQRLLYGGSVAWRRARGEPEAEPGRDEKELEQRQPECVIRGSRDGALEPIEGRADQERAERAAEVVRKRNEAEDGSTVFG